LALLLKRADFAVDPAVEGGSSTSLWTLQDPLIIAVATPPISIHCAIVDPTTLPVVLPDLRGLRTVTLINSVINDHELLVVLARLIIGIVERRGPGIVDCEENSEPPPLLSEP